LELKVWHRGLPDFAYVKFFCYATDTRNSKHFPEL
jgi:hypothetical protein